MMKYNCEKCVIKSWCDKQEVKPLVIGDKCMKYWERKTSTYNGIDFYNMDEEERMNHPAWKEMTPSQRISAISIEGRPNSTIKKFKKIHNLKDLFMTKYPALNKLDYITGYTTGINELLRYLDGDTAMEILDRITNMYNKKM